MFLLNIWITYISHNVSTTVLGVDRAYARNQFLQGFRLGKTQTGLLIYSKQAAGLVKTYLFHNSIQHINTMSSTNYRIRTKAQVLI